MATSETLSDIAKLLSGDVSGDPNIRVSSVSSNSASVTPGSIFVAIPGTKADGHTFVDDAISHGAAAAIVSSSTALNGRPGIIVENTRKALSRLSAYFNGTAASRLSIVGITGTNGKTTTNWITFHLLNRLGKRTLRVGTLGIFADGVIDNPDSLTTPDPILLHGALRKVEDAGFSAAVLEASSHALAQYRVHDVPFLVGVFTNLTRDHLDYHGDMESYFQSKLLLFSLLRDSSRPGRTALLNVHDPYTPRIIEHLSNSSVKVLTYGKREDADIRITGFSQSLSRAAFRIRYGKSEHDLETRLIGVYNALNLAASFGVGVSLGHDPARVIDALRDLPQTPGRLESVGTESLGVYVDYAHTPDALENVLTALRSVAGKRLWVIFGCGGDRDRGKRPQMAAVASRLADRVVVTSDNPRTEDPSRIIEDILSAGIKPHLVDPDRRAAIRKTLSEAEPGDVVLIAGKGHENYQILGTEKVHFSDVEEARRALG